MSTTKECQHPYVNRNRVALTSVEDLCQLWFVNTISGTTNLPYKGRSRHPGKPLSMMLF